MSKIANRRSARRSHAKPLAWVVPSIIVLLVLAGAVSGLLAAVVSPDVIGADGMAGAAGLRF